MSEVGFARSKFESEHALPNREYVGACPLLWAREEAMKYADPQLINTSNVGVKFHIIGGLPLTLSKFYCLPGLYY